MEIENNLLETSLQAIKEMNENKSKTEEIKGNAQIDIIEDEQENIETNEQIEPSILKISTVDTKESNNKEDIIWHDIQNANRSKKILTGTLGGTEKTEIGKYIAIVYYKEIRVIIPISEMMIDLSNNDEFQDYGENVVRQNKIINNMLGCEIDFVIKGIDGKRRIVVASRKEAMLRKRQIFYMSNNNNPPRITENRIVEARIIAVSEKVIRIDSFGVECSIPARDLTWEWLGDAREKFNVGDKIIIKINNIVCNAIDDIKIQADVKSITENTALKKLEQCKVQGKYIGTVTDIYKGAVFIKLNSGVNAVAHSCYDSKMPGKKDNVSFVVTKIDEENCTAVGIITRIIKQNI